MGKERDGYLAAAGADLHHRDDDSCRADSDEFASRDVFHEAVPGPRVHRRLSQMRSRGAIQNAQFIPLDFS
jgi:hypothetical protein